MNWKEPKTLYFGSCKIVIHRPDLNPTDKARIEQSVQSSLEAVMRSYIRRKGDGKNGFTNTSGAVPEK